MASLDELMKRNALSQLSANAQMSPVPTTELERQQVILQNRLQDVDALGRQAIEARQRAVTLPPPAIIPAQQDFLTPSGKGGVMDFVKGILSQRLQAKGLRRDPLDIARQNTVNLQGYDETVSALGRQAQEAQALSQQMRERAILQAMRAGLDVDPRMGLSNEAALANEINRRGLDFDPQQQFDYDKSQLDFINSGNAVNFANKLASEGRLTPEQAALVATASTENKADVLKNLAIENDLGQGLREIRDLQGNIIEGPDQDTRILSKRYNFAPTGDDSDSRTQTLTLLQDINSPANQTRRAENSLRYAQIVPQLTEAVLSGRKDVSGAVVGRLPELARDFINASGRDIQSLAGAIAQQSLRETLGGQFAVQENIQLQQRFYDPTLPPIFNLARIRRSQKINAFLSAEIDRLQDHMERYGYIENGPRDSNGRPIGFKRKKMSEILEELGAGEDGLGSLMDEFTRDDAGQLLTYLEKGGDALQQVYKGESVETSILKKIDEILAETEG